MLGEGAFVPERSMGCMALIYANPYNILCVGIEKASVNKISTNSFKKDNFFVAIIKNCVITPSVETMRA